MAIDFETADYAPDSACALGLVRVENHQIVHRTYGLIKPPRRRFVFTYLHGITWEDVAHQPSFAEFWPTVSPLLEGIDFLAAHNASFDRSVLLRCCEAAGLEPPETPFQCTVRLARQTWNIYPTKLNNVCDHLGITLKHHHAASDAEACALIVIAAHQGGVAAKPGNNLDPAAVLRGGPVCPPSQGHTYVRPRTGITPAEVIRPPQQKRRAFPVQPPAAGGIVRQDLGHDCPKIGGCAREP